MKCVFCSETKSTYLQMKRKDTTICNDCHKIIATKYAEIHPLLCPHLHSKSPNIILNIIQNNLDTIISQNSGILAGQQYIHHGICEILKIETNLLSNIVILKCFALLFEFDTKYNMDINDETNQVFSKIDRARLRIFDGDRRSVKEFMYYYTHTIWDDLWENRNVIKFKDPDWKGMLKNYKRKYLHYIMFERKNSNIFNKDTSLKYELLYNHKYKPQIVNGFVRTFCKNNGFYMDTHFICSVITNYMDIIYFKNGKPNNTVMINEINPESSYFDVKGCINEVKLNDDYGEITFYDNFASAILLLTPDQIKLYNISNDIIGDNITIYCGNIWMVFDGFMRITVGKRCDDWWDFNYYSHIKIEKNSTKYNNNNISNNISMIQYELV